MKRVSHPLATFLLVLAIAFQASSQEMPQLQNGSPYAAERKKIVANGWAEVRDPGRNCNKFDAPYRAACLAFPELDHCSNDGSCSLFWRDKEGYYLEVFTYETDLEVVGYAHPALYKGQSRSTQR